MKRGSNGFELVIPLKEKFACQRRDESIEITVAVGQAVVSTHYPWIEFLFERLEVHKYRLTLRWDPGTIRYRRRFLGLGELVGYSAHEVPQERGQWSW